MKWYLWLAVIVLVWYFMDRKNKLAAFERGSGFEGKWGRGNPYMSSPGSQVNE